MNTYIIRNAHNPDDIQQLKPLFNQVFHPEKVGDLAEIMSHHLPDFKPDNWFVAENPSDASIVSGFALIPWQWKMAHLRLKVAEMGIVGTHPDHQGKGLMKRLNHRFDHHLLENGYDLAVIQGIPGFYQKFGYHYCVPLENHIEIPLHYIETGNTSDFRIREATSSDIPFLMHQDKLYRHNYLLSVYRTKEQWKYLLTHSKETDYGSDYFILEHSNGEKYYARIPYAGFGYGLTISEVSEGISWSAIEALMSFLGKKAERKEKSYIRLNVHHSSNIAQWAVQKGIQVGLSYAWQIKIVNKAAFINKMKPLLEQRLAASPFQGWSEAIRFDLFGEQLDLKWKNGRLMDVCTNCKEEVQYTFCIPHDLFTPLVLGHRSWYELQRNRPDIAPVNQYLRMDSQHLSEKTGTLIDTLFPKSQSWIHERY